jgi:hypothetical protein
MMPHRGQGLDHICAQKGAGKFELLGAFSFFAGAVLS